MLKEIPPIVVPKIRLKFLFNDVLRGYTVAIHHNLKVYIKHFTISDTADFDEQYDNYLKKAVKDGCLTAEEKEKYLINQDLWSEDKNVRIKNIRSFLDGLYKTKAKVLRESELVPVNHQIEKYEKEVKELEGEKSLLLDVTAESYAAKRLNEYYIYCSYYKSADFKDLLFTYDEFNDLDDDSLADLVSLYNQSTNVFYDNTLKRIALSGFFLNLFFVCNDSVNEFYGKPAVKLTFYQSELFGYGRYFKNLMSNNQEQPSPELFDDPVRFVEFYEGKKQLEKLKADGKTAESFVGLTSKDKERLGIQDEQPGMIDKMVQEAMKKGGNLDAKDIMRIHGVR